MENYQNIQDNPYVSENGKDLCISCKVETEYSYDTSIDYRNYYVEGAGQLCKTCYDNIVENLKKVNFD
jgi:hypothetical protein